MKYRYTISLIVLLALAISAQSQSLSQSLTPSTSPSPSPSLACLQARTDEAAALLEVKLTETEYSRTPTRENMKKAGGAKMRYSSAQDSRRRACS